MSLVSYLKSRLIPDELDNDIDRIHKPIGTLEFNP